MIPQSLVKIHPGYGTTHTITIVTRVVVCMLSGLLPINVIAELCNMGTLLAVCIVLSVYSYFEKGSQIKNKLQE